MKKILLIGGSAFDYIASSENKLEMKISNSGQVFIAHGGVGRNVAYNLAHLGNKISMITALGKDSQGDLLRMYFKRWNIKLIEVPTKYPTSAYVAINDNDHDMAVAVFDNRAEKDINPKYLESKKSIINKFDYIFLDGNLREPAIKYICENFKNKKIFVDPITPHFVPKFVKYLKYIYLMKCNLFEARAIIESDKLDKENLVRAIFKKGLKNIVVSRASKDIYYGYNGKDIGIHKVKSPKNFKNTTGCGDALMSGIIDYLSLGKSIKEAVAFGDKLAKITLMSDFANSREITKFAHK